MDYQDDKDMIDSMFYHPDHMFEKYTDFTFTGYSVSFDGESFRVNIKVIRGASECLVCYMEVMNPLDAMAMIYNSFISDSFKPVWKKDRFAQERLDKKRETG